MKSLYEKVMRKLADPEFMRAFQGWSTIIWFIAAFPICILLAESLPFVVFISVYAIVVSSLVGWSGAGAEVKNDKANATRPQPRKVLHSNMKMRKRIFRKPQ